MANLQRQVKCHMEQAKFTFLKQPEQLNLAEILCAAEIKVSLHTNKNTSSTRTMLSELVQKISKTFIQALNRKMLWQINFDYIHIKNGL